MAFTLGTKKITPLPAKAKKQQVKADKEKKDALYKRRKESEALLFGSELFEPIAKKQKEIIIHFPETHTSEGIYISKCGKFGYRRCSSDFYYDLFYFFVPILEYKEDLEIIPSDEIWLFDKLSPAELEDVACRLKRAEFDAERDKLLLEIRQLEKERQEELDKADEEFEAGQEQEMQQQDLLDLKNVKEAEYVGKNYATMDALLTEKLMNEFKMNPDNPDYVEDISEVTETIIEQESTLEETSAIEAKIKKATEDIKPKLGFVPLNFGKVNKL